MKDLISVCLFGNEVFRVRTEQDNLDDADFDNKLQDHWESTTVVLLRT